MVIISNPNEVFSKKCPTTLRDNCCICMEADVGVSLSCGHTFCSNCLHETIDHHPEQKLSCALCRRRVYQTSDNFLNIRLLLTELLRNVETGYYPEFERYQLFQRGSRDGTVYWDNESGGQTRYMFRWHGQRPRKAFTFNDYNPEHDYSNGDDCDINRKNDLNKYYWV